MASTEANGIAKTAASTQDLFRLDRRTIIVTGGLGSLGSSLTRTLLQYGADVFNTDVQAKPSDEIWQPLESLAKEVDGRVFYAPCDVTNEEDVAKVFAQAETNSRWPVRGLVCCHGISGRCAAVDYPVNSFRKILDINVTGTFLCATAAARIMQRQQVPGSMVLLASMSGTNVNQGVDTCAYNTSKSAVLQLARNLAAEWGNNPNHPPIRVNTLSPGYIRTPMTIPTFEELPELQKLWPEGNMLGRMSTVEEHQSSIIYLLADSSSYVTAMDLRADAGHCAW